MRGLDLNRRKAEYLKLMMRHRSVFQTDDLVLTHLTESVMSSFKIEGASAHTGVPLSFARRLKNACASSHLCSHRKKKFPAILFSAIIARATVLPYGIPVQSYARTPREPGRRAKTIGLHY
eukprot:scaffold175408_cov62-Attheya_sp.AAC.1